MTCTIAQYAVAKFLPEDFLDSIGLRDIHVRGEPAVEVPYPGADCVRYRKNMAKGPDKDDRFEWKTGSKPTFYGLDRLSLAKRNGYVVLVEGESDAQTLWHSDIPALGVPGGSMLASSLRRSPDTFDGISKIFVVDERDSGAK